ncbi:SDR family oxidoreductase [Spongiimicrobium sp. 3-5]|uniref:SDR family oxidoreductase n=1 Tax=Spongiimicrobium sp. 3-5 TaxID=3332596 RepID=UPI00397FDA54
MNRVVGILGCGWLGFPLASALVKKGYTVHGSTTSMAKIPALEKAGIVPFLLVLEEGKITASISDFLEGVTILIINIPPKLRGSNKENYVKKIRRLHEAIAASTVKKIVFVSSTSVYGEINGEVNEDTIPEPQSESGRQLLLSENIFKEDETLMTTVVRFGGLIGPNRHPIVHLSNKTKLTNGNAAINLIHLNDCMEIIGSIIEHDWWNEIFNGVYPYHPTKKEFYTLEAKKRNLPPPPYGASGPKTGKIVVSNKLNNAKDFQFTTPVTD